jgi:hypothetical protein
MDNGAIAPRTWAARLSLLRLGELSRSADHDAAANSSCRTLSARDLTSMCDTRSQRFRQASSSSGDARVFGEESGDGGECHLLVGTPRRRCSSVDSAFLTTVACGRGDGGHVPLVEYWLLERATRRGSSASGERPHLLLSLSLRASH